MQQLAVSRSAAGCGLSITRDSVTHSAPENMERSCKKKRKHSSRRYFTVFLFYDMIRKTYRELIYLQTHC